MNEHRSFGAAVVVPAVQSVISGVLVGLLVGMLSSLEPGMPSLKITALVMMGVTTIAWFWLRSAWNAQLERLLNVDINRDGVIGARVSSETMDLPPFTPPPPPPPVEELRVKVPTETGEDWLTLPTTRRKMILACRVLAQGFGFTHANLAGPGKVFTRSEFERFRAAWVQGGLLQLQPGGEVELTGKGRAVVRGAATYGQVEPTPEGGAAAVE